MRIDLVQGSKEWHEWRNNGIGGSDSAAVMGETPYKTSLQLWEEKTGRKAPFSGNAATKRGNKLESEARYYFNMLTESEMVPVCFQSDEHDFMRASLDGISPDGLSILEVKCHGLKIHNQVLSTNKYPDYIYAQFQKGIYCSGAQECIYLSYNPDHAIKHVILGIKRDDGYIERLIKAETEFWNLIQNDIAPECEEKQYITIDDHNFNLAAALYIEACRELKLAEFNKEACKTALLEFTDDGNCKGAGLLISKVIRKGAVDWDKFLKEMNIAKEKLEAFRKSESSYWKITEDKDAS